VHLLQLWLLPRHKSNTPRWEQRQFTVTQRTGTLLPVVSSGAVADTLTIDQDATIYVSHLNARKKASHNLAAQRHAYLFVIDGGVALNGQPLSAGDQARVKGESRLELSAAADAELLLLDLP
jgi:redox-sensitive bicupin YhaK (pirin superfamily)